MPITAATVFYSRQPGLQKVLGPVLQTLRWPMRAVSALIGAILHAIAWPIKATWRTFRPSRNAA